MKKFLAVTTLLVCAVVLCSCTPDCESLKKKYENNGYTVVYEEYDEEDSELEYFFYASKDWMEVTVECYKNGDDAKKRYDEINAQIEESNKLIDELNGSKRNKVIKQGNAIIYGNEDAVDIA